MEKIFHKLTGSFIDTKVGIAAHFLNEKLAAHLRDNLVKLFEEKMLHFAGTGNKTLVVYDQSVRGDQIYWLDRSHNDPYENEFFDLMDDFVSYLNRTCYTGITGYEFHYTLYEKGSFYKKHLDQFQTNSSRAYSMIMYLNKNWQITDGGSLCIHHDTHLQHIAPENGTGVFFKSNELEHEVLPTVKSRMSITGWLKIN